MLFPGWLIARAIPFDLLAGVLTGKYVVTGGVIRWAAGTPLGGQIIRHLIPATTTILDGIPGLNFIPGILENIQLSNINEAITDVKNIVQFNTHQLAQITRQITSVSQCTQQILQLATGTAILSGLSLAVSSIGFIVINNKLNKVDERLKNIQQDVQAIRYFLESKERAQLYAALKELLNLNNISTSNYRDQVLHNSKQTFSVINMRYRELLAEADTIEQAIANEEYFSLTALAEARCMAELGEIRLARQEIEETYAFWKQQAQRIAKSLLLGEYPERFLASDFARIVPVSMLVEWLDFAHGKDNGYIWIDEMRNSLNERWYTGYTAQEEYIPLFSELSKVSNIFFGDTSEENKDATGLNRNIGVGMQKEQEVIIPTLRKLVARNQVFDGYLSQYQALETYNMKPSEFEQKKAELPASSAVNGYFILEPEKKAKEPVKK